MIRYRIRVEIEYFITLCELPLPQLKDFDHSKFEALRDIYRNFDEQGAQRGFGVIEGDAGGGAVGTFKIVDQPEQTAQGQQAEKQAVFIWILMCV